MPQDNAREAAHRIKLNSRPINLPVMVGWFPKHARNGLRGTRLLIVCLLIAALACRRVGGLLPGRAQFFGAAVVSAG
jgi:hypothetical protein